MNDQPGTVRTSLQHDLAVLTNEGGEAPWVVAMNGVGHCWATDADVEDWPLRNEGFQLEDPRH